MSKRLSILLSIFIVLAIAWASIAWGAGTVVVGIPTKAGTHVYTQNLSWTADASGNVTSSNIASCNVNGHVLFVVTKPGSTAPTDNYDLTIVDADGVDIMGGELANRDTVNSEQAMPKMGSSYGKRFVKGGLILTVSNNAVASASGDVKLYIGTDAPVPFR